MGRSLLRLTEESLFRTLEEFIESPAEADKTKLILELEDLSERLTDGTIVNQVKAFDILVGLADKFGSSNFESLILRDSFVQIIKRQIGSYDLLLGKISSERTGFVLCLLKIVEQADVNQKSKAVKPLVDFLATKREGEAGAKEVFDALVNLGLDGFDKEVVIASLPYLDSSFSKPLAILTGLRLICRFGDSSVSAKVLSLFNKAIDGYFGDNKATVMIEACTFIQRTAEQNNLPIMFKLIKQESNNSYSGEIQALAAIIKKNPSKIDDVLDFLFDMRNNNWAPNFIVQAIEESECQVNINRLIKSLPNDWMYKPNICSNLRSLFIKDQGQSKQLLFELLKDDKTYEFALDCLSEKGVSKPEIQNIFNKPPMLQIYNFFYDHQSKNLASMLQDFKKLEGPTPGKPTNLDFMIQNILAAFNVVSLNVDGSGKPGVDLIGFDPITLDCLIIGCTTGTIKNDISTMSVQLDRMYLALPKLVKALKLKPVIISSAAHTFLKSDIHDANQVGVTLLGIDDLYKIVEMLETGRNVRDFIKYIEDQSHNQQSIDSTFITY